MKNVFGIALLALLPIAAHAETRTLQIWSCSFKEGKTQADAQAVNGKWLKFVNGKVKGGGIRSFVVTPVTGDLSGFMFIDSFPSVEAWAVQQAAMGTPEGVALEAEFDAVQTCTTSSLNTSVESGL